MGAKKKLIQKIKEINHPGSRKTIAAIRGIKKIKKREDIKKNFATKANIRALQLSFFTEHMENFDESKKCLTPCEFEDLIERYFKRFDDELHQIRLKTQINKKRQNHNHREAIIKINLENEIKNFNAGGIELPNLCDSVAYQKLKNWDGNAHNIQHLDFIFISKKFLNKLKIGTDDEEMKD